MLKNVIEYLLESEKEYPEKIAFCDSEKEITFRELKEKAEDLAVEINEKMDGNICRPIAVCMERGVDCLVSFMGILMSGNYYSPIDTNTPATRISLILETLRPEIIISNASGANVIDSLSRRENCIFLEQIGKERKPLFYGYEKVLDVDPVYVLFTSGSTGMPKGVVISHRSVIDYTEWLFDTFSFDQNTIFGNQAPFYFDNSILDIYSTLKNGAKMVIIPETLFMFHKKLVDFINENKINTIFWVPSALAGMANSGILEKERLDYIEKILFCGEIMPTKIFNCWKRKYPDALFANLYGPTEVTDVCSYYIVDREFKDNEPLPIGRACDNTNILVLSENGRLAKTGEIGELCVRGSCLSLGYYGEEEKTHSVFIQNPFNSKYRDYIYCTGDLVKYNNAGELLYLGRKDNQIKHQGHRIELGEIEQACFSIKGVNQCCAVYKEEEIFLYCSLQKTLQKEEIFAELRKHIPKYMLPKQIHILEELPLNLNGKIDRIELTRRKER
ncbi:MAG: amino acid adenylation domain-containing protein [Acetivibrio ethanolgignens]